MSKVYKRTAVICKQCGEAHVGMVLANNPQGFRECEKCGKYVDTDLIKSYITVYEEELRERGE